MEYIYRFLMLLDSRMETPTMFGWFHILFLILGTLVIIYLCRKYKEADNKKVKKILLICSTIMILFEIYKQINFSFNYEGNSFYWKYQWYAFPFQFCSTPMYVALLAALTKNKKIENTAYAFLATYGLVGGLSVMLYPSTVFVSVIGISIQTMVHHGLMVVMGLFLLITNRVPYKFSTIINGMKMFLTLIVIALTIDVITYYINIDSGLEMFFISPFHTSELPVFNMIYENVPYIIFLLSYIFIFTLGSSITILISKLITREHIAK